jgi:hypothetical protein
MPDSPLPDPPIDIAILIEDAQAARVAAHIRVVLSRFKSHGNPSSNRKVKQMDKGLLRSAGTHLRSPAAAQRLERAPQGGHHDHRPTQGYG